MNQTTPLFRSAQKLPAPAEGGEAFAVLRQARRVWAVAAVRAEAGKLAHLHQELAARLLPGDRLVYLGDMIGHGPGVIATLDEAIAFRRDFLCLPGAEPDDIVFLRGAQEEMWRKLLQIQFAPGPAQVFDWMMRHGLGPTLEAYGIETRQVPGLLREGATAISRWTNGLRAAIRRHPGHDEWFASIRRAAYTEQGELLFAAAGIDPALALTQQGDRLWWGAAGFNAMTAPYAGFRRVVSGIALDGGGAWLDAFAGCLDGNAGRGGQLNAVCFALDGTVSESFAV